jgi:uncharacterized FlgJ-related protein
MDFAQAIEFSQKFPTRHPKIFIGFNEWGIWDNETEGYVVLADAASESQLFSNQLEDYVKSHNLRIDQVKDYLMIATLV